MPNLAPGFSHPKVYFLEILKSTFSPRPIRWESGTGLSHEIPFTGSETTHNMAIIGGDYRSVPIRCKFYLTLWFSHCLFYRKVCQFGWNQVHMLKSNSLAKSDVHIIIWCRNVTAHMNLCGLNKGNYICEITEN